ncbi:hypothetical protein N7489_006527 [Penicillium chrysogenum]|uniref:uncharacterized protein n=1 Tax=Penicillium chrysogenum TaxID=5076 RepID=UPI0024DF2AED|nr:uncharacterized protein N7489_006527 [Penicillium chrysogenum]KAJ5236436.1 hypothetical protein N7489_006527 [Penicillium chrysogenum]
MESLGAKLRFVITAGVGFFADGYLNLTVGLVVPILGYLYFEDGKVSTVDSDIMKGGLSLGMVIGQLLFGVLSDVWGRHAIYGKELILTRYRILRYQPQPKLARIGYANGATTWQTLYNTAVGNIIIQAAGYLPGFYVGIFLPDCIGRVRQQFWTCIVVCILYAIWAGVSTQSAHPPTAGLMIIFALSQFFLTVGPNCTTFLIPAEVFPTRVRGTAHGISGAAGKCGAIITAFAFGTVEDTIGLEGVLGLFSGIMFLTALVTLLIPETKNRSLEGIENDELYRASSCSPRLCRDKATIS